MKIYPRFAPSGLAFGFAWGALRGLAEPPEMYLSRLGAEGFAILETTSFGDPDHVKMLLDHGLQIGAAVTGMRSESEIEPKWEQAKAAGAQYIRFKYSSAYAPAETTSRFLGAIQRKSEEIEIAALLETHRNTATQDLYRTAALLRDHPDVLLLLDLSHMRVAGDFGDKPGADQQACLDEVLGRVSGCHGRVSNGQQVQLPVVPAFEKTMDWCVRTWARCIVDWSARAPDGASFPFIMELLPPDYAMVGADGAELSDRWTDSVTLKNRLSEATKSRD